jgi:hypothetical protein
MALPLIAVTDPPQLLLADPYTVMPTGRLSVSGAFSVATLMLGLFRVMVRVETPFAFMLVGEKALASVGGAPVPTVNVATAA